MTDEQLQRIHDIEYSCDSRAELAERIVALEDKLAMYENNHQIALRTYGSWKRLKAEVPKLREENEKLRDVESENASLRGAAQGLGELCDKYKAENAKLREELAKARDPQRIGGQADPSSFVYAIEQLREFRWQHATNDEDAIPYINNVAAAHERENAKLREKAGKAWRTAERLCQAFDGPCVDDGVTIDRPCPLGDRDEECVYGQLQRDLRELGVEVD